MELKDKLEASQRNKANYLKAKELFNQKKIEECVLYYSINHKIQSAQSEQGRQGIQQFLQGLHQSWANLHIVVEHVVAEDNFVMGRSVALADHSKVVMGIQPTGKQVVAAFWDLHLFNEEGLIIESWNLIDNLAIMQQIGFFKPA